MLRHCGDALYRGFSAHAEIADRENALLRRLLGSLRIERDPHLTAADLGIDISEPEKGAGLISFYEHHLAAIRPAPAQIAEHRRVAPELGRQREVGDNAAAPGGAQIEAAQCLAMESEHGPELHVD